MSIEVTVRIQQWMLVRSKMELKLVFAEGIYAMGRNAKTAQILTPVEHQT